MSIDHTAMKGYSMTHRESYVPQRSFGTEIKSSPALNSIFSEESLLRFLDRAE